MKNRVVTSVLFIFIGALLILFPLYILPVCPLPDAQAIPATTVAGDGHIHMHSTPGKIMKCFWTARAEIGIGSLVIAIGALVLFSRSLFVRMGLSMALACTAVLAAAIPTILIGVCGNEMMRCNMGAKPALILLAIVLAIAAISNVLYLNKQVNKQIR
ncbi:MULTISPECIES: DUF4418 family protein [Gilliamella]|uniref:DUF4418 domain-containing protein n=1 Tax=Gilliamella apis TaxID=1970738 RepID=A0A242P3H9_9GAMM|nr:MULTISPECIES: DUF4418 family protein [Gilliamella]MBI0060716.1 DUF4418 family protein [Gilliamella sp. M0320]MBI0157610.1 DUF4418 family protein [Gilliamella sp. M0364]MCT6885331.1 DUF4418 family protein [Gilliamella apis]OCG05155.1 hypothetical protein A9G15_01715 [Gilliamella apis]OTQ49714.1 hypothetical protein B6D06_06015 [Gilliamella apis]